MGLGGVGLAVGAGVECCGLPLRLLRSSPLSLVPLSPLSARFWLITLSSSRLSP